jgi:hypothetical protein
MTDGDVPSCGGGERGEFACPQPGAVSVGSSAVGRDEDTAGVGVVVLTHLLPPCPDGGDGDERGIVVDAD